jgi:hypothetical protein
MLQARKYMAASVPRYIRQSRAGYLPANCLIGSRTVKGEGGANLSFDIVMLPAPQFLRMKTSVGQQFVIAPTPAPQQGLNFNMSFMLTDTKEVTVPEGETDPEGWARHYFMIAFGLIGPEKPAE